MTDDNITDFNDITFQKHCLNKFTVYASLSDDTEPISYFSIVPPEQSERIRMTDIILDKTMKNENYSEAKASYMKKYKGKKVYKTNQSAMDKGEMLKLRKKIKKEELKKPIFLYRSKSNLKAKHIIRRIDHFCKNKSVQQFVNAWRSSIGYDSKDLEFNPNTKKLLMEFD